MKKLSNLLILSLFSVMVFAFAASAVLADEGCTPIYGGGQTCPPPGNISLDKTVRNPENGIFVNNLTVNDPKYLPNQSVSFKVVITNTTSTNISKVTINDVFPSYLTFESGPGSYDSDKNTLTFSLDNLKDGESRTYDLKAKVTDSTNIPFTNGVVCVVNQVMGTTSDNKTAQDNAQLCIQKETVTKTKGGLPVEPAPKVVTTPATGPEMLPLLALLPGGLAGFILRKRSKISK